MPYTIEEIINTLEKRKAWYKKAEKMSLGSIPHEPGFDYPAGNFSMWDGAIKEIDNTLAMLRHKLSEYMTITEVLNIIHGERIELEVYEALHKWMVQDRARWIDRAINSEATVKAVHKIATNLKWNHKDKITGIIELASEEYLR